MLLISFTLLGCSGISITKEECENRDWAAIGVKEGARGVNNIREYLNSCREVEISLKKSEVESYQSAWRDSFNINFCTKKMAYTRGIELEDFGNLNECTKINGFSKAYSVGKTRGILNKQISNLKQKVRDAEGDMISKNPKNKNELEEIKTLKNQVLVYEKEIRQLERELALVPQMF